MGSLRGPFFCGCPRPLASCQPHAVGNSQPNSHAGFAPWLHSTASQNGGGAGQAAETGARPGGAPAQRRAIPASSIQRPWMRMRRSATPPPCNQLGLSAAATHPTATVAAESCLRPFQRQGSTPGCPIAPMLARRAAAGPLAPSRQPPGAEERSAGSGAAAAWRAGLPTGGALSPDSAPGRERLRPCRNGAAVAAAPPASAGVCHCEPARQLFCSPLQRPRREGREWQHQAPELPAVDERGPDR